MLNFQVFFIALKIPSFLKLQRGGIFKAILGFFPESSTSAQRSSPPQDDVKIEDEMSDSLGQLALDEYGHMRWIGGSSTMSLISSFRALASSSPSHRISPMDEDPNTKPDNFSFVDAHREWYDEMFKEGIDFTRERLKNYAEFMDADGAASSTYARRSSVP